ncbi:MAG TPA: zinc-ribbon domain-containing protein [Candidatus Hydrogenedentes bacterium]|mgnify:CR=1 FL=1|nr:zinc-ribbon domain-containing protein [Candidatus Hydrogenedentota bacterium]
MLAAMLIIFGANEKKTALGETRRFCPVCGRETQHTVEERTKRLTLYFIPVLPLNSKRVWRCNLCGHEELAKP